MMKTCLLAATLCAVLATAASAQGFPNRPIRIVVPYPAGGTTDAMARVLQEPLQKLLGHSDLKVTSVYAHLSSEHVAAEVRRLSFAKRYLA